MISGLQTKMITVQGQPQIVGNTHGSTFRQVLVTDASGNKVPGNSGSTHTSGLTLPQKPTPPGITLVKPAVTVASIVGTTSPAVEGTSTVIDKQSTLNCMVS